MNNTNSHNTLEPHTPILDSLTNSENKTPNHGFVAPQGYFEDLSHHIITLATQSQGQEPDNSWKSAIFRTAKLAAGFAAMVVLAITVVKLVPTQNIDQIQDNSFAQIEELELLESLSTDDLLDVIWSQEEDANQQNILTDEIDDYMEIMGVNLYEDDNYAAVIEN